MRKPTGICAGCNRFIRIKDGRCRSCRAALADTHPKDGDVKQAPLVSGAVGEAETPKGTPDA